MVIEHNLRLLIVDERRVILLVDDRPPMELDEAATQALTRFLLPTPAERKRLKAEPWLAERLPSMDVIEPAGVPMPAGMPMPAPERHWRMPHGITRHVTGRNSYPEAAHPLLHAASHKVLRAVAELGRPVVYREVRERMAATDEKKMPDGTVSSQLHGLAKAGYLLKQQNPGKAGLIYTLTPLGEDVLTRPDGYPQQESTPS